MKLMLYNSTGPKKATYKNIGYWQVNGKTRKNVKLLGLGNVIQLKKKNENFEAIIKEVIKQYDEKVNLVFLKSEIDRALENRVTYWDILYYGFEFIKEYIEDIKLLNQITFDQNKEMKEVVSYQIANKIINPKRIIEEFYIKNITTLNSDYSKSNFHQALSILFKNKSKILDFIFKNKINKENNLLFFDSKTIYLENIIKDNLQDFSFFEDYEFYDDQVVLSTIYDDQGIPIFYKTFAKNTEYVGTLIPLFEELKERISINKLIIIINKEMSSAENIKFLESNNIDFIIPYKTKTASKNENNNIKTNNSFKSKKIKTFSVYKTSLSEAELDFYWNQEKIQEIFKTLKSNDETNSMLVYNQNQIEESAFFSFISLYVFKNLLSEIKAYYKELGSSDKITDKSLINILNSLEYIVEKDTNTKEIIRKFKKEGEFSNNAWKIFEEFEKYIKTKKSKINKN
ncbi:IS1634 family transposase [Mycoplasma sp. 1012]